MFDYIIIGEGYDSLIRIFNEPNHKEGIIINNTYVIHPQDLPLPDFKGLNLNKYISPENTLSIYPAKGCYWGKCTFCNIKGLDNKFYIKKVQEIVNDMIELNKKYSCNSFYFSCDVMPIKVLIEISKIIINNDLNFHWQCEVRFEGELDFSALEVLYKGGCRMLRFGLKSGSVKTLDIIRKGINLSTAKII